MGCSTSAVNQEHLSAFGKVGREGTAKPLQNIHADFIGSFVCSSIIDFFTKIIPFHISNVSRALFQ
jgi:hypothetical protein